MPDDTLRQVTNIKLAWQQPLGLGYSSPVCNHHQVIVMDRVADKERIQAFDIRSGERLWHSESEINFHTQFPMYTDGPIPTPAIHLDQVYTVGASGRVQCLDAEDGSLRWSRFPNQLMNELHDSPETNQLQTPPFGNGASPILHEDSVLVALPSTGNRHSLFRLKQSDGSVIWSAIQKRCSYASPVLTKVNDRWIILYLHNQGLSVVAWDDGTELFNFAFRAKVVDSENAVDPIVSGNRVFISAYGMPGTMLEIDSKFQCQLVWKNIKSIDSQYTNIILHENVLLGFSARTKRLHAADWRTGQSLGRWKLPMTRGMLVADQKRLLVLGDNSTLAIVDVADLENVTVDYETQLDLKSKVFCSPCVVGNQMLVRDEEKLVAFELQRN